MNAPDPSPRTFDTPFIRTVDGVRSLHFALNQMQSCMISQQPNHLGLDYTRSMMGFLMFDRPPVRIAMIGLGGGSLLKFCHRYLPQARLTVIEINPQVIALRQQFEVPEDDARLTIVCADGAEFIRHTALEFDVLLIDGFDSRGQALSLCTQAFYNDCFQALAPQGVMVVNLQQEHPDHLLFSGRMALAFDGNTCEFISQDKGNCIAFARKDKAISVAELKKNASLQHVDPAVRAQLQSECARICRVLSDPA